MVRQGWEMGSGAALWGSLRSEVMCERALKRVPCSVGVHAGRGDVWIE